jgi:putative endopeptidase
MRIGLLVACCLVFPLIASAQDLRSGLDKKYMDLSVRPQDNLFLHMNGNWLKHTPIPPDKSNFGSFSLLEDEAQLAIREICEECAAGEFDRATIQQQIGDFYTSYLDEDRVEKNGIDALRDELAAIDRVSSYDELVQHFGHLGTLGVDSPIGFYVDQDDMDSTRYLPVVIQAGTSLPDRDYYLEDGADYQAAREALVKYVDTLFELSKLPHDESVGKSLLALETEIARLQWTKTELRDAHKRYNKRTLDELQKLAPSIPWKKYFDGGDIPEIAELNVATPSFFEQLDTLLAKTSLESWKQYLRYQLISGFASGMPPAYVEAQFALYGKQLGGIPELKPRWKRAVDAISGGRGFGVLGDAVGQLYVERHFPHEAKARMDDLVANLMLAYKRSIQDLTWMTSTTKRRAEEKLARINTKIGHTEKWRDYSTLVVERDDLLGNLMRSAEVEHERMIAKLGKPVDRTEWFMTPQTINAYYNAGQNEIVFPAAILQPPFFDVGADDAVNYGSIGAIIGHEISHAFDDQGSKYDADGNLKDWWTDTDRDAFHKQTARLVEQYNQYAPLAGKTVNGELTLGENIADLSGMSIAYKAYQLSLDGYRAPEIDGWTGDQRFFLGWAQSWQRKYRDAEMINRLLTDPHSPSMFRANGPCTNFDPFYPAFDVKPGDQLYRAPEERITIW